MQLIKIIFTNMFFFFFSTDLKKKVTGNLFFTLKLQKLLFKGIYSNFNQFSIYIDIFVWWWSRIIFLYFISWLIFVIVYGSNILVFHLLADFCYCLRIQYSGISSLGWFLLLFKDPIFLYFISWLIFVSV